MSLPTKPKFGSPCNHCGACCIAVKCPAGQAAFPGHQDGSSPCPALVITDDKAICGLVLAEKRLAVGEVVPLITMSLGIGCGCSMHDPDTTEQESEAFDRRSVLRMRKLLVDWKASIKIKAADAPIAL